MDRLSPASEQRKYSLSKKIAAIAGGLALAAGLGACGSKAEVGAQGGSQTTAVATETPGNHLSGENPGIGEAPQNEVPAAENAPENTPPEGGLPEVTVPREDVENGNGAQPPVNPEGAWEPRREQRQYANVERIIPSYTDTEVRVCYRGKTYVVPWPEKSGAGTVTVGQPAEDLEGPSGSSDCYRKGSEADGWHLIEDGSGVTSDNSQAVCIPRIEGGQVEYYGLIATRYPESSGRRYDEVLVGMSYYDSTGIGSSCNPSPDLTNPQDVLK